LLTGNAFAGQSGEDLQACADGGGRGTRAGSANHLLPLEQGESRASGAGDVAGPFHQQLESGLEVMSWQGWFPACRRHGRKG